jgi:hypothetical protein
MQQLNGTIGKVILPNVNRRHIQDGGGQGVSICILPQGILYASVYQVLRHIGATFQWLYPCFRGPGSQRHYCICHLMLPEVRNLRWRPPNLNYCESTHISCMHRFGGRHLEFPAYPGQYPRYSHGSRNGVTVGISFISVTEPVPPCCILFMNGDICLAGFAAAVLARRLGLELRVMCRFVAQS